MAQTPDRGSVSVASQRSGESLLTGRGLSKRFGNVVALQEVDFEIRPAEFVALIGDNGAGKSTLVKILSGALVPDSGSMHLRGAPVAFANPRDARAAGIETVYQDLALAPDLDIASNLFLGREIVRPGILGKFDFYDAGARLVGHRCGRSATRRRRVRRCNE